MSTHHGTAFHLRSWHVVALVTAITIVLIAAELPRDTWLTSAALSLSLGAAALALMGTAALLGGRWPIIESLLGGLDRVYLTHKWLAIWALAFASFHFVVPAELEAWDTASILPLSRFATRLVRQLSFVALMLIVLLALNRKIPYSKWRLWHKVSGPLFVIVILHWLSIRSPIVLASPAGLWLGLTAALGTAAAAYKLLLYPFLAKHAEYRVVTVSPGASSLHLELAPVKRLVEFRPGQFGFLRMKEDGLREPHPFTIASGGGPAGHVHFVIRALGDYTAKLLEGAAVGMHADIYAPYGRFERRRGAGHEAWIAGGVGISPFIAWLTDEAASDFGKVTLFYFFTPGREFPSASVLENLARRHGTEFVSVAEGPSSPQFVERFGEIVRRADPDQVQVSFCGPKGLLERIRALMRENGVPEASLHYEYFEFR